MVDLAGRPPRPGPRLRPTQRPPCFPPPPSLVGRTPGGFLASRPAPGFAPLSRLPSGGVSPLPAASRRGVSPLSTPPTPLAAALGATALGAEKSLLRRSRLSRPTSLPPFRCPLPPPRISPRPPFGSARLSLPEVAPCARHEPSGPPRRCRRGPPSSRSGILAGVRPRPSLGVGSHPLPPCELRASFDALSLPPPALVTLSSSSPTTSSPLSGVPYTACWPLAGDSLAPARRSSPLLPPRRSRLQLPPPVPGGLVPRSLLPPSPRRSSPSPSPPPPPRIPTPLLLLGSPPPLWARPPAGALVPLSASSAGAPGFELCTRGGPRHIGLCASTFGQRAPLGLLVLTPPSGCVPVPVQGRASLSLFEFRFWNF
ncbi:putative basic proline-rich protein-like [Iris pallida]|uniref:Basic proline-rich protein-like n=1 Tax=Iris pallida TaxID=29817 RepID=A0AAX6E775_IRIPA|nr:putative basic proline-rich protein-like [Iris pallida]